MTETTRHQGAIYYRLIYPGHLRLSSGCTYQVPYKSDCAAVYLKRHLKSTVIVSHDNDLCDVPIGDKTYLQLRREIDVMPKDAISVEFQMQTSEEIQKMLCTKEHFYTSYCEKPFSEIFVGVGREGEVDNAVPCLEELEIVLGSFLELYRAMSGDLLVRTFGDLSAEIPVVWVGYTDFGLELDSLKLPDRINHSWPSELRPWHFDTAQYGGNSIVSAEDHREFAVKFASYLSSGSTVPSALSALMRCAQVTDRSREPKWAVVESFTIAEMVWNDFFGKINHISEDANRLINNRLYRGRIRAKDAINSILPNFIPDSDRKASLIRELNKSRKKRDDIIHHGYSATVEDARASIDSTWKLIASVTACLHGYGLKLD